MITIITLSSFLRRNEPGLFIVIGGAIDGQSSLTTLDHRISYISISAVASGSNGDIGMLHRKEHVTFSC